GAPSILSIDLVDGEDAVPRFVNGLQCFTLAANIGDARSLVIHPATTTHSHFSDEQLAHAGFSSATVRLSIELEDPDHLIADIERVVTSCILDTGRQSTADSYAILKTKICRQPGKQSKKSPWKQTDWVITQP